VVVDSVVVDSVVVEVGAVKVDDEGLTAWRNFFVSLSFFSFDLKTIKKLNMLAYCLCL